MFRGIAGHFRFMPADKLLGAVDSAQLQNVISDCSFYQYCQITTGSNRNDDLAYADVQNDFVEVAQWQPFISVDTAATVFSRCTISFIFLRRRTAVSPNMVRMFSMPSPRTSRKSRSSGGHWPRGFPDRYGVIRRRRLRPVHGRG